MGSVLDHHPWLYGFADEFSADFAEFFAKHYAKAHNDAWADTLSKEVVNARIQTQREIASSLLENTDLTHKQIAECCELSDKDIKTLAKELAKENN